MTLFGSIQFSAACLVILISPFIADAAELEYAEVERDGKRFVIDLGLVVQVPLARARNHLDDYAALATLSPTTLESALVPSGDDDEQLLRIVLKPCILIFCKRLTKVSRIYDLGDEDGFGRRYEALADRGSFARAIETLRLVAAGDATLLLYQADLEPNFFVPGVIGSWLIRRTLVNDLLVVAQKLEHANASLGTLSTRSREVQVPANEFTERTDASGDSSRVPD